MIKFDNVTATYKKNIGVFNINFEVNKSELIFIMGPTGAGKSTILRAIYRDINIDSGKIFFDNKDITECSYKNTTLIRRKIGMIFQDYKLILDRTIHENIALPLRLIGLSKKEIDYKVNKIFENVGLKNSLHSFPEELSGGEQQRVSIARALVKDPLLVLADEPTGNLDPNIADEIIDILENVANKGSTVLMSTHNYPLIKNRDKRFIELNDGKLVQ